MSVLIRKLEKITVENGDVLKIINKAEDNFQGFGEAYFSRIDLGAVKAWKRHLSMYMNLVVPIGEVKFNFIINDQLETYTIGETNYSIISVPPGIWFGFEGLEKINIVLNFSNIIHSDSEVERASIDNFSYKWI